MASTRAGHQELQPGGYRAFIPKPLPPEGLKVDEGLLALLSAADIALGRLDGAVGVIPDPDLFVIQYVRREAVLSSQIEGTHASLMDVLEFEAQQEDAEAKVDVAEIVNYVLAMNHGLGRLDELPVSRRLMCEVHQVLMRDVRGGEPSKTPGRFRSTQNWIGGGSPKTARFVPPPADVVPAAFADLERFLHDPEPMAPLIRIGLAHAQFETIHPFLDGNGRTGRLLITFWLVEQRVLSRPVLYTSLYFKENKDEYVQRLQAVRDDGAWEQWLAFYLDGVAQVATEATATATGILELRERDRTRVAASLGRRSGNGLRLLDELFKAPLVTAKFVERVLDVSQPTAGAIIEDLVGIGVLRELTGKKRYRRFAYTEYLDLFAGADARS